MRSKRKEKMKGENKRQANGKQQSEKKKMRDAHGRKEAREGRGTIGTPSHRPDITRKVDVRLPGKGKSNFNGATPVHPIITMIKWIRTSRLSIKLSVSLGQVKSTRQEPCRTGWVRCQGFTVRG